MPIELPLIRQYTKKTWESVLRLSRPQALALPIWKDKQLGQPTLRRIYKTPRQT